jgi:hypothetical protein
MRICRADIGVQRDFRYIVQTGQLTRRRSADRRRGKMAERRVFKTIHPAGATFAIFAAVLIVLSVAGHADDDFPLSGNYTQNVACKGDGTDPTEAKVTISLQEIVSNMGVCSILDSKRNGDSLLVHVECKFASGPVMGDITFTPRPDNTLEFVDRDSTYKAVLHRCPK